MIYYTKTSKTIEELQIYEKNIKIVCRTAVVILNWNGKRFLEMFLPSVIKYSNNENAAIVVADNGSTDNSVDFLKANFPLVEIIEFEQNYGFTGGYNKALDLIDAEYFVILNSDVEVSENWLSEPLKILSENEKIAAVAPKILSHHDKNLFEYAGAAGGFIDKFGYPFCRGRIIDTVETDKSQYDDEKEIFWASGACLFIKAKLFKESGGFDDDFFAHMEEIDLCWRLQNKGFKIKYTPKSIVYHVGGGALPQTSPRKVYLNFRNNLFMIYKNLPQKGFVLTFFMRLILDGLSAFVYLAKFKFSYFGAVFKAHISFYKKLKTFKNKRKHLKKDNKKLKTVFRKSIVWQYYMKKKKTFNKLEF